MHSSGLATPRGTPSRRGKSPRSKSDVASGVAELQGESKSAATLTTCLSIPVEGAVPIEAPSDSKSSSQPNGSASSISTNTRRAPRQSKTDALAALRSQADSDGPDGAPPSGLQYDTPIPVTRSLDLRTVKTIAPRKLPSRKRPRAFGLKDCPIFYPSPEEFKDPMKYIKSISEEAEKHGICKIVPPAGWKMPFVTDTETFRFKTRLMVLNSIEAKSRAKLNFLEKLYRYHKQQGNPRVSVPTINHKALDLWALRQEVQKLGGYDVVMKGKRWTDIGRSLGYTGIPGLSTQLKNSYTRVILPYEHFYEHVRNSAVLSPMKTPGSAHLKGEHGASLKKFDSFIADDDEDSDSPPSPLTATSSPLSEPSDDGDYKDGLGGGESKPRRTARTATKPDSLRKPESSAKSESAGVSSSPVLPYVATKKTADKSVNEQSCEICHKKDHGEEMLLCDGCDCGFHIFCLDPPLSTIPRGQWFCHSCLFGTGRDYGFDEGEEHSLSSFQARDREFRRMWFTTHPPSKQGAVAEDGPLVNRYDGVAVTEDDVEEEFWRLVQSTHESVEIEYGADVHSTTHGTAMPTLETHPLDPYSKDPWNLSNMPILSESLLRFIKTDISGMTVPWTYVGMIFSTFCWHNEDHYTASINYMHWGETKTWYGIPGAAADKFEAAIKREAPDLFEAQPDLLFQLVTLMNPQTLRDADVPVYACNQRAGEFVITFPKAYHAGFNHGLNFNEAVNFALPDWLPFGRECVERYREHYKPPVFSHDELLVSITQQSPSIKTASWLLDNLREMTDREFSDRKKARALSMGEVLEEEDKPEDQYQCTICKAFCYLSQVTCQCGTQVACVNHLEMMCECPTSRRILRKRFSDEALMETLSKVEERAAIPVAWRAKLQKLLTDNARPQLRSLRALLAEADRINYSFPELGALRKCVVRANQWVESANSFLVRKPPSRKRPRKSGGMEEEVEEVERNRTIEELHAVLNEVESLGFDAPEIGSLQAIAKQAEQERHRARLLLPRWPVRSHERKLFLEQLEYLLSNVAPLNVHFDELNEVQKIIASESLLTELQDRLESGKPLLMEEIQELLGRVRACGLTADNKWVSMLYNKRRAGSTWEDAVKDVVADPNKTIDDMERLASVDSAIPVGTDLLDELAVTLGRAKHIEKTAKAWLVPEPGAVKPRVQDAVKLIANAEKEFNILAVQDLKRTADFAQDLELRCEAVLTARYQHREDEDIFETIDKWKRYGREHLTMFYMPHFEKLDIHLKLHYRWLETLPWYCVEHRRAHGKQVLDDVMEATKPDDDLPPTDEYFTCICTNAVRPPPAGTVSDAVQCDYCYARFHGVCATNGGSCPFCDHHHWDGSMPKERDWHFCYLPNILMSAPEITKNYSEDWKHLELIVHRVDRLSGVIGHFLSFSMTQTNQRPEYIPQVRHFMRKLYKIQFVVAPSPDISFGLDLAGLHRILAGQPGPVRVKRRRPKFTFGQDIDKNWIDNTRCICRGRTSYLANYPTVTCEHCSRVYHAGCVFFSQVQFDGPEAAKVFMCPLCCLRKNRPYPYAEVRVRKIDGIATDQYVNIPEMLDTFSKDLIYVKLAPPCTKTLFVELVRFTPGQPETTVTGGPSRPNGPNGPQPNGHTSSARPPSAASPSSSSAPESARSSSVPGHQPPPPPPWQTSSWRNGSAPHSPAVSMPGPPAVNGNGTSPASRMSIDQHSVSIGQTRKRKHTEDVHSEVPSPAHSHLQANGNGTTSPMRSPKRRTPPPSGAHQTMSPYLAMMLSPSNSHQSPRGPVSPSTYRSAPNDDNRELPPIIPNRPALKDGAVLPSMSRLDSVPQSVWQNSQAEFQRPVSPSGRGPRALRLTGQEREEYDSDAASVSSG